jgi:hypothetical protein
MIRDDSPELDYYRTVEDLFSAFRGVPHVLSPKDFQLVRSWWHDQVPLAAIRTGVAEVFARRRDRGETEPVVSLSYCRHAVAAQARRLAEMRVGGHENHESEGVDVSKSIRKLAARLSESAKTAGEKRPRAAAVINRIGNEVLAAVDLQSPVLGEYLYALEATLFIDCLDALEDDDRSRLEERARTEAENLAASPEARERTFCALRDRLLREILELPRLEIEV